ncbi:ZIP family metal transporter [Kocuria sp. LUK]|uniref:ZIP family metal transporter n=1 Tax=Kocuria TaxID=57493 RepID=UPI001E2D43B5|nr:ZIP family metal transporter [Kocuria sp. LUK]MCD1144201.1 ZIP family metal transporter [Kocuria sp. LUK]
MDFLEPSTADSVWIAAALTAVLAALHLAAPRIRSLPLVPERRMGSFAGGLAVAYVFLHLLPELAAGNEAVGEALSDVVEPTPLLELAIFLVALTGFTAFYGLERLATAHGDRNGGTPSSGGSPTARGRAGVYWLHLGSFMVYNVLITYTMVLRVRTGLLFAVLFTVAMGLHFVLTDRGLAEHYPRRFATSGRALLAAALVAGWVLASVLAPTSTVLVAVLTALLGGSVLLNVFKEEVPTNRSSSFAWFSIGLVLYSALLAVITGVGE